MDLIQLSDKVKELHYRIKANKDLLDKTRADLNSAKESIDILELAGETLKKIGEQKKKATTEMIERVVSAAIKEVFGFDYKFVIEISSDKRVLTKFKLVRPDGLELDLMNSVGGGLLNVISFCLKTLMLVSIRPKREPIMFLDESFANLSREYAPKVATLLRSLSEQLRISFVLVSHTVEFAEAATDCYEVSNNGLFTTVTKV